MGIKIQSDLDLQGSIYLQDYLYHSGDTNTYIKFDADRIRLIVGGTTKFDSNSSYLSSVSNDNWSGTDLAIANGGTGASSASAARTNLGLGTAATSASTDFVAVTGDSMTGQLIHTTDSNFSVRSSTNGIGVGITFSDHAGGSYAQYGTVTYFHGDGNSYGSGNAFVIGGSETTMTVLADGKLMYGEGIYSKPSSGTGAGTRKDSNWDTAYGWGDHSSAGYLTSINNGNWSGTDLSVGNGGTGASTAAAARTNLGLGTAATSAATDFLAAGSNLSDLGDASEARTNLGLGSAATQDKSYFASASHTQAFSTITSTPTTLAGYGITDAFDGAYSSLSGKPTLGTLAALGSVNAATITDNSVGAAELNVTGNGTTAQFLRSDGDGTFSWATPSVGSVDWTEISGDQSNINISGFNNDSGYVTSSGITAVSAGDLIDVSTSSGTATVDVDLSELTDMTQAWNNSADEFVVLDGGVQKRKLSSEIFGSNAFNSTSFLTEVNWNEIGGDAADINISGFNNDAGYLTTHPSISAASSSDNSGRTYIQDITLDSNGHVTGITTATETVTNTNTTYTAGTGLTLTGTEFSVTANTYAASSHSHSDATTSAAGFMSAADKTKLDGVATGADVTPSWVPATDPGYSTATGVENNADVTDTANVVAALTAGTNVTIAANGTISSQDTTYTVGDGGLTQVNFTTTRSNKLDGIAEGANAYVHPTGAGNKHIPTGGAAGQFLKYSSSGTAVWATPSYTTNTNTVTSVGISGSETTGTVTLAASGAASVSQSGSTVTIDATNTEYSAATTSAAGLMSSTDKTKLDGISTGADVTPSWVPASDPGYLTTHPSISAATSVDNGGRTYIQDITLDSNGHVTGITSATETVVNTNTTYSAGNGLDLSGTTFSVEPDLRDGITHVGVSANNYITFDETNNRIDFYAGNVHVARMESDGDLHIKGDVIAFSSIFS